MSDAQLYHDALTEYRNGSAAPELVSKAYVLASGSSNPHAQEVEYVKLRVAELKAARRIGAAKGAVTSAAEFVQPHIKPALSVALWTLKIVLLLISAVLLVFFAMAVIGGYKLQADEGMVVLVVGILFGIVGFVVRPRRELHVSTPENIHSE